MLQFCRLQALVPQCPRAKCCGESLAKYSPAADALQWGPPLVAQIMMSNGKEPFVNLISDSIANINLSKLIRILLKDGLLHPHFLQQMPRSLTHPSVLIRIRQGRSKQLNQVLA